jgi:hypothetical protein
VHPGGVRNKKKVCAVRCGLWLFGAWRLREAPGRACPQLRGYRNTRTHSRSEHQVAVMLEGSLELVLHSDAPAGSEHRFDCRGAR